MTQSAAIRLFAAVVLLAATTPAAAAVTAGDQPASRTWYERYASAQEPEQTERISRVYQVGADAALDLQTISGDVRVTAGGGSEIRVEAVKQVRHRDSDEAQRLLEAIDVEITQVGDRVQVRTRYPRVNGRVSASVDYAIIVPDGAAVAVKTISGDVRVERVGGEVRAESVSGDVEVTATPNLAIAKTVSGDVTATDIGAEGTLTLGSVSGNVIARNLTLRTLEAGSVSGDLDLFNLDVERLEAKSVSGNIELTGSLARGGRYELSSHSGNVRLHLVGDTGFELDANAFSGSIRSDLPITLHSDSGGRSRTSHAIRGTYGDASAILSVRTFSGNVVIGRQ